MIHVTVTDDDGIELASIRIERVRDTVDEVDTPTAEYSAQLGVDTGVGFAVYQRLVTGFPRKRLNVLGLLRLVLSNLEEKELTLDGDPDLPRSPSDARASRHLAREIGGALFKP